MVREIAEYPMRLATSVYRPPGTPAKMNTPAESVVAARDSSTIVTCAATIGAPVVSVTRPRIESRTAVIIAPFGTTAVGDALADVDSPVSATVARARKRSMASE
jgi:hypothetical protein